MLVYVIISTMYGATFCSGRRSKRLRQLRGRDPSWDPQFDRPSSPHHHRRHHHSRHNATIHDLRYNKHIRLQENASFEAECKAGNGSSRTWQVDQCEKCWCEGRTVNCERDECPQLTCDYPVSVEKECCRMCPEQLCHADDGRYFKDGATWHMDDCTNCECQKGKVLCSVDDCQWQSCKNPVKVPGKCCPVCLTDSSCISDSGDNHTAGAVWKIGVCTHCYCRNGEQICADEKCPHINCSNPIRDPHSCCYKCPDAVECILSTWGSWSECPIQECGGGMQRRFRGILVAPRQGGAFCPHKSEAKLCPRLDCKDLPVCPTTPWSEWGHCTATCGPGRRMRTRKQTKVTKAQMHSLIDCSKTNFTETIACHGGSCLIGSREKDSRLDIRDEIDCSDALTWGDWGPCSNHCGEGIRTRVQIRKKRSHSCNVLSEQQKCVGEACNNTDHCQVSKWSPWSACSHTCGPKARKTKLRTILQHPAPNGRPCPELLMTAPCEVPQFCETNLALDKSNHCVSEDGTKTYAENERWDPVECRTCVCRNSIKVCSKTFCPEPDCENPEKYPGLCCPIC